MAPATPPGWHGKLPALGDFVSRRIDATWLEQWDPWLAQGMLALREQLGDDWLDAYLASPSWRFLLMPGALAGAAGDRAWAGVLMPSVDKVGRYFPFTIVQPLASELSVAQMPDLWRRLEVLDSLAADALHDDWDIERLESELARNTAEQAEAQAQEPEPDPAALIAEEASALWRQQAAGIAYWQAHAQQSAPRWVRTRGLPDSATMVGLLGGAAP